MMEDFFKKNMEMWEQFTSTYMETMFKTVERTMEQSQAFRAQMDEAAAKAVASQFEATQAALQTLQRQVEALSTKVDQLLSKK